MNEIWKDVKGYEGIYQVSNLGRVKSLERQIITSTSVRTVRERIMRVSTTNCGYDLIGFSKDNKRQYFLLHRLIAQAFVPNPCNRPCVNHKDEDKRNNAASNLEWCTHLYNNTFATRMERVQTKRRKPVVQKTCEGDIVKIYPSGKQASIETGINYSVIAEVCKNRKGRRTAGGYKWEYYEL